MVVLLGALVGLIFGSMRGGRVARLAQVELWGWALVALALGAQLLVAWWLGPNASVPVWLVGAVLLGSYLALLVVAWRNRRVGGMWVVGVGILLNTLATLPTGGLMPTTPEALAAAGRPIPGFLPPAGQRPIVEAKDIVLPENQVVAWPIADRFSIPAGWPLASVFSPGDVVVSIGLAWVLAKGMQVSHSESSPADHLGGGAGSAADSPPLVRV